jgi:methylmalonyl-CoA/ethylmalonyl-CoA epimerase
VSEGARLDHVAIAVERWSDAFPRYVTDLGGRWVSGGQGPGFAPAQLVYRGGMKVEILRPNQVEVNDFLRRFLDRSGPGPHHLTYKVDDLPAAIEACESAGFPLMNIDLRDPQWQEAFVHPKAAGGIVVQLAQTDGSEWRTGPPTGFPETELDEPADLRRVVHAVRSLGDALALFEGVLGGLRREDGDGWVELSWPPDGRVRLVEARTPEVLAWIDGLPGRVHEVAFAVPDPAAVPGAERDGDRWIVPPERNLGVRLALEPG